MRTIIFIKKIDYEELNIIVKNEFLNLSYLNKSIPTHVISGEDFYAFEVGSSAFNSTYVKLFRMYTQEEASSIIKLSIISYDKVIITI